MSWNTKVTLMLSLSSELEINDFVAMQLVKLSQFLLSPKIKISGDPVINKKQNNYEKTIAYDSHYD